MKRTVVAGYGKQLALHLQHPSESNSEESSLSYGGLGCNNPGRVVLDEARAVFGKRRIGCLVSIGTGQAQIIGIERPGLFQQIVPINDIEAYGELPPTASRPMKTFLAITPTCRIFG